MMISVSTLDRQPCLFEALPASEPRRRAGRRPPKSQAAPPPAPESPAAVAPQPPPSEPASRGLAEPPSRLDPDSLTHPDLSDLVGGLAPSSLAFLLVETVREARRRLEPEAPEDEDATTAYRPNPVLVRALRTVLLDLTESE